MRTMDELQSICDAIPSPIASDTVLSEEFLADIKDGKLPSLKNTNIFNGIADIFSIPPDKRGKYAERSDINQISNLITQEKFYEQCGGLNEFSDSVANKIGGYPKGAILDYIDSNGILRKKKCLVENCFVHPTDENTNEWETIVYNMKNNPFKIPTKLVKVVFDSTNYNESQTVFSETGQLVVRKIYSIDESYKDYDIPVNPNGDVAVKINFNARLTAISELGEKDIVLGNYSNIQQKGKTGGTLFISDYITISYLGITESSSSNVIQSGKCVIVEIMI